MAPPDPSARMAALAAAVALLLLVLTVWLWTLVTGGAAMVP